MNKVLLVMAVAFLAAGPLFASDKSDVRATVQQITDAFNKGDAKAIVAACTDEMCIIDEFSPYEWHGAGTCSRWLADYDTDAKKNGITDGIVTLGKTRQLEVNGDRAYAVVLANYTFRKNGKALKETNATWTFALQKVEAGWRVTGWAWAKN